ncbi:hypothetical protein [Embleya sp. NPDC005575]|uniref:hypothetical protein n=1 Tax=Embleya sp. NPDC005575 TaxID=3156892 RepID=UPI0033BDB61E
MVDRRELAACEDVVMFVNAAVTSTGQREFRDDAETQRLSVEFLHEYVLGNYRELYAATLALDINDFNAALLIRNLLENSRDLTPQERRREGELIARRLELMAPQRVYKLFRELARRGVNNRRTRAIMRDWTAQRRDPVFDAVKYRTGVKATMRHAHLAIPGETGAFLFTALRKVPVFTTPLYENWRQAHYAATALYKLPYTVAEGLASKHGIDRATFLAKIAPQLTRLERLRLQGAGERAKVGSVKAELAEMPLTRLASYVLSLSRAERTSRYDELRHALTVAAGRAAGNAAGSWGRVVAVLDDSFSSYGSVVKRQRPLAVALACRYLLKALAREFTGLWTSGLHDPLLVRPSGPTPLGERLIDALELAPDRLVVVSDGWDNSPPGLAAEVLRVWRERLDPDGATTVVHLNPVYDADGFDVKRLSASVPTVGVRDAEDVPALIELARFAEGRTGFAELRGYLAARRDRFPIGKVTA